MSIIRGKAVTKLHGVDTPEKQNAFKKPKW